MKRSVVAGDQDPGARHAGGPMTGNRGGPMTVARNRSDRSHARGERHHCPSRLPDDRRRRNDPCVRPDQATERTTSASAAAAKIGTDLGTARGHLVLGTGRKSGPGACGHSPRPTRSEQQRRASHCPSPRTHRAVEHHRVGRASVRCEWRLDLAGSCSPRRSSSTSARPYGTTVPHLRAAVARHTCMHPSGRRALGGPSHGSEREGAAQGAGRARAARRGGAPTSASTYRVQE